MQRNLEPSRILALPIIALCACLIGGGARASSLTPLSLETLSTQADRILVGTVEKSEAHFVTAGSRYIVTDVTVRSERNLLGVPEGSRFVVRHLGGVVGELGQRVFGEASYRVGEQVLLFASERQGAFFAMGMAQGALHVYRDSSGISRVDTQLGGAELVAAPGRPLVPAAATTTSGRSLDEVTAQVQAFIARRTASRKE